MRALVVGLGSIGVRHLDNLRRLGCGHLGVLRTRKAPLHKPVELSGVTIYEDFEHALAQGYDAVVICNPTSMHLEYAQRAAEAGCHLYLEKPVSHTLDNTARLRDTVRKNGLTVMVGCQLRFHPNLTAVKRWLDSDAIGHVLSVQVDTGEYLPDWHPWEDYRASYASRPDLGGGVVLTFIHEIDFLSWLLGPLTPICSFGGISGSLELDVEDHVASMLVTSAGVPVMLRMDYLQRPPCRSLKIVGARGTMHWDYYAGIARLTVNGRVRGESHLPATWDRNDLFVAAMSDFLDSVCDHRTSRVPLEDGIETLCTALEIRKQLAYQQELSPLAGSESAQPLKGTTV